MKKAALALFIIVISFNSFSQITSIGLNGGFGKSWNSSLYTNYENKNLISHTTYGISFFKTTKSHFAYGADLNYSFVGANLYLQNAPPTPSTADFQNRLQYLRLPLKVYYLFGKPSAIIHPKVYLAPTLGYLLYATSVSDLKWPGDSLHYEDNNATSNYTRIDFGIQGGAGLNFRLTNKITLSTDINCYQGLRGTNGSNFKNTNASLNIGLLWNIYKK